MAIPPRPTVLIADADPAVRASFSEKLAEGHRPVGVESIDAALGKLDDRVDVALLDWASLEDAGEAVIERLRTTGFDGPVAVVTDREPTGAVLEAGFDGHLVKPVTAEELHDVVETLLLRERFDDVMREYLALVGRVTSRYLGTADGRGAEDGEWLEAIKEQAVVAIETAIESGKVDDLYPDVVIPPPDARPASGHGPAANDATD